jgi:hypothetical protein
VLTMRRPMRSKKVEGNSDEVGEVEKAPSTAQASTGFGVWSISWNVRSVLESALNREGKRRARSGWRDLLLVTDLAGEGSREEEE